MIDLVVLVADKNMQFALRGALSRPAALGIRPISFEFRTHPGRDGGVRSGGPELLALERARFRYGLVVFDHEGSGAENVDPSDLELELDDRLNSQWGGAAKAIVVVPEVDVWVWGSDNALKEVFDWPLAGSIRDWAAEHGFQFTPSNKPVRPKEALEAMRSVHRQPRSSALYEKITSRISLQNCTDPGFARLRVQLQQWFPVA